MASQLIIDGDWLIDSAPHQGRVDIQYMIRWLQKETGCLFARKLFFNVEWPANERRSSPFIRLFRQAGFIFKLFPIDHIAQKYRPCENIAPNYRYGLDAGLKEHIIDLAHDPECNHLILVGGYDSYSVALDYFTKTAGKRLTVAGFSSAIDGSVRGSAAKVIDLDPRWNLMERKT